MPTASDSEFVLNCFQGNGGRSIDLSSGRNVEPDRQSKPEPSAAPERRQDGGCLRRQDPLAVRVHGSLPGRFTQTVKKTIEIILTDISPHLPRQINHTNSAAK